MLRLAAILAVLLIPLPAGAAASYSVSPLGVQLASNGSNATITITNRSTTPLRIQATPYAWSQTESNDMVLKATKQLAVFPTVFTVEPGQARKIRVGSTVAPEASQRAYRLVLEELPAFVSVSVSKGHEAIDMRTRLTLPIVLRSTGSATRAIEIKDANITKNAVHVALTNTGNSEAEVSTIRVRGLDGAGKVLFDGTGAGWYLLPGVTRRYVVAVPAGHCANVKAVSVDVSGTNLSETKKTIAGPSGACDR